MQAEIARLADAQHGVVERSQLVRLGLGGRAVDRWLEAGALHQIHAGVYAVGHRRIPQRGWWMAAALGCGSGAVLSHWSAAELWGLRQATDRAIHVTLLPKSRHPPGIRRHSSKALPPDEVTVHEGIPVTSVPRTVLDLAAVASADIVENAVREAEYLELRDPLSLPQLLARYRGRRGVRRMRAALARIEEEPSGRRRSPLEERFVPFLRRHDLPIPRLNAWIDAGGKRYQVDCLWPNRQIVELDGWQGHGTKSAFRDDRTRDRRLRVAGYAITRLTWSQLDDEPTAIAADLRVLLRPSGQAGQGRRERSVLCT
ncbi:MAG TPA: type IV toxin-antitoxin system AbiEi family antitoxin domain-containing protein [Solirubrobacterales bacterium]|nr:type IV toxin-antitoxin system AbiEi family antitoxin domain-containing protein [Solirubrobacterales bacterium]